MERSKDGARTARIAGTAAAMFPTGLATLLWLVAILTAAFQGNGPELTSPSVDGIAILALLAFLTIGTGFAGRIAGKAFWQSYQKSTSDQLDPRF